jgi:hypothetical protein
MKNILIIVFLVFGPTSFGQNYIDYLNKANEAEHDFIEGNLTNSKKLFLELESKFKTLKPKDQFYLGLIYYFNNDTTNGLKYFSKAADQNFWVSENIKKLKEKFPTVSISNYAAITIADIEKKAFNLKYKQVIADSLKYFSDQDQLYRVGGSFNEDHDKIVQTQFINFLERNGVPNPYIYGDLEYSLITCHVAAYPNDSSLYKKYRDFNYKQITQGNVMPFYYCRLIDRNQSNDNKTTYGCDFVKFTTDTPKEKVIENRKKIGQSEYYNGPRLDIGFPKKL